MIATVRSLLSGAILSGTPLLYATVAEVIGERAGIVNLGLEGVMLMGAVAGFIAMVHTQSAFVAVLAGALAGGRYIGSQIAGLPELPIPFLGNLPIVGPIFFCHDLLVYASVPVAVLAWWALFRTRWGLHLRAVGENPVAAFAAGKDPHRLEYQALFIAGLLAGIAGAHLSLGLARTWSEWMTAGRAFIAVALVISSRWQPLRAIAGALLFGGAISLQFQAAACRSRRSCSTCCRTS